MIYMLSILHSIAESFNNNLIEEPTTRGFRVKLIL